MSSTERFFALASGGGDPGGAFHVPTGLPTVEEQVAQGEACFVGFIMMVIGISIGAADLGVAYPTEAIQPPPPEPESSRKGE